MNEAMINALFASVFGKPGASAGTPQQNAQGPMGHLGAHGGMNQGAIGAMVPQTSEQPQRGLAGLGLGPQGQQGGGPGPGPPAVPGMPQGGGGLASLMPLLALLPHVLPILASLFGGGAKSGSR